MSEKYQFPPGSDYAEEGGRAVTVGITSTPVASKNPQRGTLTICNDGATDVYLRKSATGALLNSGIPLRAMTGSFSCGRAVPDDHHTGDVCAISSASCNITVTEENIPYENQ